ncbi:hypothetical protein KGF54_000942 [Candida jiufengensis]|uniref:uncharacterized protein n=1 Tax=Candida jiufengensis TaxID=497108 RepID=UPI002225B2B6|nr:uncharacterized protein KGF54_000942 [Candida jiufengensis]KAI5956467.1 hypothetical protein KGF54_000942 [Candida jiufengensis]
MNINDLVQERDSTPLAEPNGTEQQQLSNQQEIKQEHEEINEESEVNKLDTTTNNDNNQEPQELKEDEVMEEAEAEITPQPIIKTELSETPRLTPQPQIHQPTNNQNKKLKQEQPIIETSNLPPLHEIVGGSSIRRYLNKHLTKHLLDGLKEVGDIKPDDPLRYLGEFLIARSDEQKNNGG